MKKSAVLLLISVLFMSAFVSAQITIQQPAILYNAGDDLTLTITVDSSASENNFLETTLICDDTEQELFKIPFSVKANEPKEFSLDISLVENVIGELSGRCTIKAFYGDQTSSTSVFEISKEIIITPSLEKTGFDPNEVVKVNAQSQKKNGKTYDGYAEASIDELDLTSKSKVSAGSFNLSFTVPQDAKSKRYVITIYSYEEDEDGNKINEGRISREIVVNRVVKKIDFALNDLNVSTGGTLVYRPLLIDQAGEYADGNVDVYLVSPNSEQTYLGNLKQQTSHEIAINSSYYPGTWYLTGKTNGLESSKDFEVDRMHKASFDLQNSTLIVQNIGNVEYSNTVTVKIGDETQTLELALQIGEIKEYQLNAPDGEYQVSVEVDDEDNNLGRSYLTGNAISLEEVGKFVASDSFKYIMWGILILALISVVLYFYRKNGMGNYYGHSPSQETISRKESKTLDLSGYTMLKKSNPKAGINQGRKEVSNIIAVKIKNYDQLREATSNALENIESALSEVPGSFHTVNNGNSIVIIASPSLTGHQDNNLSSIKVARKITSLLNDHNARFSQKIDFGVSVSLGELITEKDENGFKYAPMGSAIPQAKKIADHASNEVLISDEVHKKTMSKVKVQRFKDYWKITRLAEDRTVPDFAKRFNEKNKN